MQTHSKEVSYGSLLHEVPGKERNERCQENNHEKRPTGNAGCVPEMRDQDVQDRQKLAKIRNYNNSELDEDGLGLKIKRLSPFFIWIVFSVDCPIPGRVIRQALSFQVHRQYPLVAVLPGSPVWAGRFPHPIP